MPSETAAAPTARLPKAPDPLPCPRCQSANTKFCYYNNYNLSQPRHFCKSCRRYWTHGGALRNVPVGGGTRKNSKRCRSSSSCMNSASTAATKAFTPIPGPGPELPDSNPNSNPDLPALKCENSWDYLNPNVNQSENLIPLPSVAQQEPGFVLGYGSDIGYGFGYGVWGIGESGDGGEPLNGDCIGWPSVAISMPAKGLK